ncbi:hypothetical protein WN51_00617 [Melipona quadrifasciata]|uniref:Uncharacterized protein n=1 Tax=Melipona quadrifasciata TaxID=166423 RepID=A0A0M9A1X9_9HYME|nr:hypothetical protein WN51_00617 [Melipona quadrifasciata]
MQRSREKARRGTLARFEIARGVVDGKGERRHASREKGGVKREGKKAKETTRKGAERKSERGDRDMG